MRCPVWTAIRRTFATYGADWAGPVAVEDAVDLEIGADPLEVSVGCGKGSLFIVREGDG
jgi:hypothetical protein